MSSNYPKRILIVRFSSIGDIVLTFPVVAAIKSLFPNCKIHYVTKKNFKVLLEACPAIDEVFLLEDSLHALRRKINFAQYDAILDLHNNLRTRLLFGFHLKRIFRFPKNNLEKWLLTTFKISPKRRKHVVERYLSTLSDLVSDWPIVSATHQYSIPPGAQFDIQARYHLVPKSYVAIAIGAQFATKRLPTDMLIDLIKKIDGPVLLLGGKEDQAASSAILDACQGQQLVSAVGLTNIHESAWLVKNARILLTHDTGLMHIGASFDVPLHVIWGNTIRDFGMYPYRIDQEEVYQYEVTGLSCRPCSKIGHQSCPKGHFACMRKQDLNKIALAVNSLTSNLQ
jgi:ADP-heptose:LPS heptosyltransferase